MARAGHDHMSGAVQPFSPGDPDAQSSGDDPLSEPEGAPGGYDYTFGGIDFVRKAWLFWGQIILREILKALDPQKHAQMMDSYVCDHRYHEFAIGIFQTRGCLTSTGVDYGRMLKECVGKGYMPPTEVTNPLVNGRLAVVGDSWWHLLSRAMFVIFP